MSEEIFKKLDNESDYYMWKKRFTFLLLAKDLEIAINGEKREKEFTKKDAKAKFLLINALNDKYVSHIINCETAQQEMLQKLDKLFLGNDQTQLCQLLESFYKFEFRNSDILIDISNIENIVTKIKNLGFEIKDMQILSKNLSSLPKEMANFRTAWESTPSAEKTVTNLISRIILEKKLKENQENFKTNENDSCETNTPKDGYNFLVIKNCYKCGKKGHIAKFCRTNSYNSGNNENYKKDYQCYKCLKNGHRNTDCNEKNNCIICKNDSHYTKFCLKRRNNLVSNYFINYIQRSEVKETEFILDSGATYHILMI